MACCYVSDACEAPVDIRGSYVATCGYWTTLCDHSTGRRPSCPHGRNGPYSFVHNVVDCSTPSAAAGLVARMRRLRLSRNHKRLRLQWAYKRHRRRGEKQNVVFSDELHFNLSNSDGCIRPMKVKRGEHGTGPKCKDGGNERSTRKPADQRHRPALFPGAKTQGATPPELETGSPLWEACALAAEPPWSQENGGGGPLAEVELVGELLGSRGDGLHLALAVVARGVLLAAFLRLRLLLLRIPVAVRLARLRVAVPRRRLRCHRLHRLALYAATTTATIAQPRRVRWQEWFFSGPKYKAANFRNSQCGTFLWMRVGIEGRGKRKYPEKTLRTIPTCENPGVNPARFEPGSQRWEASALATTPPLAPFTCCNRAFQTTWCSEMIHRGPHKFANFPRVGDRHQRLRDRDQ
ncbi:hypothetical protein PR048_009703 [Dryococelus australis]|uniref:Uncharacterized protein n=1 Tax=Dryococelus australis TaxID=614101 RepID=A0ABQ9I1E6_9NEOP|nr:hypothetical protein PR048_009703 [Dryococelus australis]